MRRLAAVALLILVSCAGYVHAQSTNASLTGYITDPTKAVIVDAKVIVINVGTNIRYETATDKSGSYDIRNVPPGTYRIEVEKPAFKTVVKPDVILHVQDAIAINFEMVLGSVSEIVTVEGGAPLVNTESASVSTVVDRQFVENLPLNGRSFNTLLQLTPGVVIGSTNIFSPGQFSIAGQRADANAFMVDGVSANFGVGAVSSSVGSGGTGAAQAFSALGGTSSLVSVEALQEFRVQTSSFAPEFGRSPGGQVILTTRAGTNEFHGGIYEYFRNDALDANDWFANAIGSSRAPERHNNYGGFLSGPVLKDHTFFFASYEGARLRLPQATVIQVPSLASRSAAPATLVPFLNAFPQPNGPVSQDGSTAQFTGVSSNRASLDAGSFRIDHTFNKRVSVFGRYNDAPSGIVYRAASLSTLQAVSVNTRTLTMGSNLVFGSDMSNSLRGNYSTQGAFTVYSLDSFGGAVPLDPRLLLNPLSPADSETGFGTFDTNYVQTGPGVRNHTTQLNFADDLSIMRGTHRLQVGADYRAIFLDINPDHHGVFYTAISVQDFLSSGAAILSAGTSNRARLLAQSLSLYGQDTWKVTPRLTLVFGLRWELSPAPSARSNTTLASWENVNNPAQISLAPAGTSLWSTTLGNFAPRAGLAYRLTKDGSFILRTGGGIFYDLGTGQTGSLGASFPNVGAATLFNVPLPVPDVNPYLPAISVQPPYLFNVIAFSPSLKLPRSYQWNVALEKSFGDQQATTVTYVGQAGRDQLRVNDYYQPNPDFSSAFQLTNNSARSAYNALQVQYRRRLFQGLQALLNYTWSHSLDNSSNDTVLFLGDTAVVNSAARDRASSDFDVRHSFSGAVTYELPGPRWKNPLGALVKHWSVETLVVARGGFPFNMKSVFSSPIPGTFARPDRVPGQPAWISSSSAPGGQILNANAFAIPPTARQGSEGRNDIPGFGLTEVDLSIGRKFPIGERLNLQFRVDGFNVLNHPNFANPYAIAGFGPTFLQASSMANQNLGGAGLNPLFQEGGPRSLQLSLKLQF